MVLGSSADKLVLANSCLAGGRIPQFRGRQRSTGDCSEKKNSVTFTPQPRQWVKAALLVAGEEAVTVQEVGPGHVDALKGVAAVLLQGLTRAAAWLDGLVILTGGGEDRAADETYFRGALAVKKAVDDAQEEVLRPRFCIKTSPVAKDVRKHGSGEAKHDQNNEHTRELELKNAKKKTCATHLEYPISLQ